MLRTVLGGFFGAMLVTNGAVAQTCGSYPNTLTNGTTADANQVMANFNSILNCANTNFPLLAPFANPHFTGNVGVATTTPEFPLEVHANTSNFYAVSNPTTAATAQQITIGEATNNSAYRLSLGYFLLSNIWNGIVQATASNSGASLLLNPNGGAVGIGTTAPSSTLFVNGTAGGTSPWTVSSDARLKKNIQEITDAVGLVKKLRGVRYQWRPVEEREVGKTLALPVDEPQIGFIAQDVETVVPEAVSPPKAGSNEVYGLKEAKLLPILVEAVKEQQAEIDLLRATVASLTSARAGKPVQAPN